MWVVFSKEGSASTAKSASTKPGDVSVGPFMSSGIKKHGTSDPATEVGQILEGWFAGPSMLDKSPSLFGPCEDDD